MTLMEMIFTAAGSVGAGLAGYVGSKRGSGGALNGTADTVREIREVVVRNDVKLDGHIEKTASNFREISDRTSQIEGRLAGPPVQLMAKKSPRKPTRQ